MTDQDNHVALEIKTRDDYTIACMIDPSIFRDFTFEQIQHSFVVLNSQDVRGRYLLLAPSHISRKYSTIENGPTVTLKMLVHKD